MISLLIRADDLGYSEAVNYGIEKSVKEGLVRSVGVMPNMPAAAHGLKLLEGTGVCLGQHTNVCLGKPCADPSQIPSLLDELGNFKSSKIYREALKKGEEVALLEELVIEVEAQYFRFKELTGIEPGYFEAHAVPSKNLSKALAIVAEKHNLKWLNMNPFVKVGYFCGKPLAACPMESMNAEYDPFKCLQNGVAGASEEMPNLVVCHPGYLDEFLLSSSSLTLNRTKEVTMLCDPKVHAWLAEQDVNLITYDDIC